jgi:hypothetical protein
MAQAQSTTKAETHRRILRRGHVNVGLVHFIQADERSCPVYEVRLIDTVFAAHAHCAAIPDTRICQWATRSETAGINKFIFAEIAIKLVAIRFAVWIAIHLVELVDGRLRDSFQRQPIQTGKKAGQIWDDAGRRSR